MQPHDFRRFLNQIAILTPGQLEDAGHRILDVRRRTEALAEIEARTKEERNCPSCGSEERQKWGRTRTGVQRFRCSGCGKTRSGRTGSAIGRIHRPDLFLEVLRDMLADRAPSSIRRLADRLGLDKHTIWRWRMMAFEAFADAAAAVFTGIVEVDETYQRESRKGSREWVRHHRDPASWPKPPRLRWHEYGRRGVPMMRGLSRWQLPILTVADRSGSRRFERIPDRGNRTIERALSPLIAPDAALCSDAARGYLHFTQKRRLTHFVVASKPGARMASPSHHIQTVNSLHSRYGDFIRLFRGPASKNLQGYLQWFIARQSGVAAVAAFRRL